MTPHYRVKLRDCTISEVEAAAAHTRNGSEHGEVANVATNRARGVEFKLPTLWGRAPRTSGLN